MNTMNEKVEPKADLQIEVDQPQGNISSTGSANWVDRLEDWVNFLGDVVKILTE